MLCGLRLVWRKFCSEILIDLPIRYQYELGNAVSLRISKCVSLNRAPALCSPFAELAF